ncbi:M15 family metallopeptidase [Burkholderia metallica]|uniref:M15 family metallopeptidase n=1 Tax=Burkholderia metallica TaxID=488729 RepID=A0ABT8PGX4_9BURK|nr:M15 family metallopeptidase [Burkholderia metallica]MDN7933678.1 M15 family metallopeptidase [Burkholderia metallica]
MKLLLRCIKMVVGWATVWCEVSWNLPPVLGGFFMAVASGRFCRGVVMETIRFKFSQRSEANLAGVNEPLVKVVRRALERSEVDFGITEGMRTRERQRELVAAKKSQTMNSRHLTGHAVDVMAYVNGAGTWEWKYYEDIARAFKQAAAELGIPIVWGGDWKTLKDGVHFELAR